MTPLIDIAIGVTLLTSAIVVYYLTKVKRETTITPIVDKLEHLPYVCSSCLAPTLSDKDYCDECLDDMAESARLDREAKELREQEIQTKVCTVCNESKSVDMFPKVGKYYRKVCKTCFNKQRKVRYASRTTK